MRDKFWDFFDKNKVECIAAFMASLMFWVIAYAIDIATTGKDGILILPVIIHVIIIVLVILDSPY